MEQGSLILAVKSSASVNSRKGNLVLNPGEELQVCLRKDPSEQGLKPKVPGSELVAIDRGSLEYAGEREVPHTLDGHVESDPRHDCQRRGCGRHGIRCRLRTGQKGRVLLLEEDRVLDVLQRPS